jgi:hypothetical protein
VTGSAGQLHYVLSTLQLHPVLSTLLLHPVLSTLQLHHVLRFHIMATAQSLSNMAHLTKVGLRVE